MPTFTDNVTVNKTYPGVIYEATETSEVYHEDHEIDGIMYRAANAQYVETNLPPSWQQVDVSQASYAIAQNTDGSISYLYMPLGTTGTWTTWQGQGQPVTYYAVNYGLDLNDLVGTDNVAAINAAIQALITAPVPGGTVSLPAGKYYINGPIVVGPSGSTPPAGIIITGVSGQTEIIQLSPTDIFDVSNNGGYAGIRFRDLILSYTDMSITSPLYAVNVVESDYVTCERVHFSNCPTAFQTDGHSEFCGLLGCQIYYDLRDGDGNPINNQTMVLLNGPEGFIANCVLFQMPTVPYDPEQPAGPSGCTAVVLASQNASRFISNTHIAEFAVGIQITQNIAQVSCEGLNIEASQNAVIIQPATSEEFVYSIQFSNCTFQKARTSTAQTSGVVISTNGGENASVSGIYFSNCAAYGWGNAGIEIDSGENIVIVGGQYSSNGQNPTETYLGAGIVVAGMTGGADQVTISGVDCSGVNNYWAELAATPVTQPYGIAVSGLVSDVTIAGCQLPYNASGGVLVALISEAAPEHIYIRDCNARDYASYTDAMNIVSSAVDVQITDCAGYNDQGVVLHSASTPPVLTFTNTTYSYRGPIVFYVWGVGATSVVIGTLTVTLGTGSFALPCGVSGRVNFSGTPSFAVIGM